VSSTEDSSDEGTVNRLSLIHWASQGRTRLHSWEPNSSNMKLLLHVIPILCFLLAGDWHMASLTPTRGRVRLESGLRCHLVWGDIILACVWEQVQAEQMLEKAFKLYLEYWIQNWMGAFLNWGFWGAAMPGSQKVMSWQLMKIECTRFRGNNWNLERENAKSSSFQGGHSLQHWVVWVVYTFLHRTK